jgi:CheY-like chemotaxis protein
MKLSDNTAKIHFPQDDRSFLFFQSQQRTIKRGATPLATLLLADDSLTTQKVVNLTFADEGVEVITASDGDTALQLFHDRRPDIVLADVNMPGMNGYALCEEIRKTEAKTPVVLLVGSFEPFDAQEAHRVGANDYLTKPFSSIRRLVATVLAFVDDQGTAEPIVDADEVQEISVEPINVGETHESPGLEQTAEQTESSSPTPESGDQPPDTEPSIDVSDAVEVSAQDNAVEPLEIQPGPTPIPEPDPRATVDIEELYSQSFVETIEMPRAVAESVRFDDVSADDELIETTYTGSPSEAIGQQVDDAGASETPMSTAADIENPVSQESWESNVPSENLPLEPTVNADNTSDTVPGQTQEFTAEPTSTTDARTEEYNFESRLEEAYFEPAAVVEATNENENSGDAANEVIAPVVGAFEDTSSTENLFVDQSPASTPWDTVASPGERVVSFDDSNLLELPGAASLHTHEKAEHSGDVSPEMVERIAQIVASQMSEQLIREIAERVVPLVVEQSLSRNRNDANDQ